jgi:hypothetical protein
MSSSPTSNNPSWTSSAETTRSPGPPKGPSSCTNFSMTKSTASVRKSGSPEVRKKAARLVSKYLHVLPRVTKLVDSFCERFQSESALGVHIRSTAQFIDGHFNGQSPCLHRYLELIDQAVSQNQHSKIYAASDSQALIEFLRDNFRNLITYDYTRSPSSNPLSILSSKPSLNSTSLQAEEPPLHRPHKGVNTEQAKPSDSTPAVANSPRPS